MILPTQQWILDSKITADDNCRNEIKRRLLFARKVMTNLDSILESRDITDKGPPSQSYRFSSSHVWMWELDYKEIWAPKNLCFWTAVLEKTLESPLDSKEIQPVHPKGNQSCIGLFLLKEMGKQWKQWQILFSGASKSLQMVTIIMKLKDACSLEEKLWQT